MTYLRYLSKIALLDIRVWVENDQLCYEGPEETLTDVVLEQLIRFKGDIIHDRFNEFDNLRNINIVKATPNQKQLWIYQQQHPESSVYNIPILGELSGDIKLSLLTKSITSVLRNISILNSKFIYLDGEVVVLSGLNSEINYSKIIIKDSIYSQRHLIKEARKPFDLTIGKPYRIKVWRLQSDKYFLQLTVHHIISDGWSCKTLIKKICQQYISYISGNDKSIDYNYKSSFENYAFDLNKKLYDNSLFPHFQYWKNVLDKYPQIIEFPAKRSRETQSFVGHTLEVTLDLSLCFGIDQLSQNLGVSKFSVWTTIISILLHKLTGQNKLLLGFVDSNRSTQYQQSFGYFSNTLLLPFDYSKPQTGICAIKQAMQRLNDALKYAEVPFHSILETLNIKRKQGVPPLIQVIVGQELSLSSSFCNKELNVSLQLVREYKAKFDLSFYISHSDTTTNLIVEYNTALINRNEANAFIESFNSIANDLITSPNKVIKNISPLTQEWRQRLLVEWNHTHNEKYLDVDLLQLISKHVHATPNNIALYSDYDGLYYTYKDIVDRTTTIVHRIRELSETEIERIAILLPRSIDLIATILSAIKLGATFVPIDIDYPQQRIDYILDHSKAEMLVTIKDGCHILDHEILTLYTSEIINTTVENCNDFFDNSRFATQVSILYTSGSTGLPKGVICTYAGLVNRLLWMKDYLHIDDSDVILYKTSIGFDVAMWEIFLPLITGSKIVLAKQGGQRDVDYLAYLTNSQGVTVMHFVPTLFGMLLKYKKLLPKFSNVKHVVCSGEPLTLYFAQKFNELFVKKNGAKLHNFYGPTEASIDVTAYTYMGEPNNNIGYQVPIGKPIANVKLYILDDQLNPVMPGSLGQIYISGICLAEGYLYDDALTSKQFITNPYGDGIYSKLYRTGDFGVYTTDQNILFLGRQDRQVKIRGNRIELDEVEATIAQYDGVSRSLVEINENNLQERQLVAYIEMSSSDLSSDDDIRQWLIKSLPNYMLPDKIYLLAEFPVNASGKVDISELRKSLLSHSTMNTKDFIPQNDKEKVLQKVWQQVLSIGKVPLSSDFYSLGGNSITALKVVYLAEKLGVQVSLEHILATDSIRTLAKHADIIVNRIVTKQEPFALINEADKEALMHHYENAYPLTQLQCGLIYNSDNQQHIYNSYVTSLHLRLPLEKGKLETAINEVIAVHPMLRTSFNLSDFSEPLQLVHKKATFVQLEVQEPLPSLKSSADKILNDWIKTARKIKFDWSAISKIRFFVHRRSESEFQLTLVEPFLDGWSVAKLMAGIISRYHEYIQVGFLSVLDIPCYDFQYYVGLELRAKESGRDERFWHQQLDGISKTHLPAWPRQFQPRTLERISATIPTTLDDCLSDMARRLSVPLKSVLLYAHCKVLSLLSGLNTVTTGVMTNGRPGQLDADNCVGLFLNVIPLTLCLDSSSSDELVNDIFEAEMAFLPYRRFPLGQIFKIFQRDFFDVVFNYVEFEPYRELLDKGIECLSIKATD
ncbi:hypothetical protein AB835_06705 [Candidatus Endobugula sertula]|uniref:Carrier domain-containing protein n=1 Tax=Candidatus Endobugula sertula TaxID=62101 RepID=A0A1D2QQG1_9GAMM|nr:hypothetical protein AB835_06705 [Candidatus Endobugula sertula]